MNLDDAIKTRFSCRTYSTKELNDLDINKIIDAARYAPSPKNRQPWRFMILRKKEKEEFLKLIQESSSGNTSKYPYGKQLNEYNSEKETYKAMSQADTIVLIFNKFYSSKTLGLKDNLFDCTNIQAIGAAIQNMILKGTDLGIGSLWICDIFTHYKQICDHYYKDGQLVAAIALGYSVKENKYMKSSRIPLDELIINKQEFKKNNIIWVGPKESDICDCQDIICSSVTLFGTNNNDNISYCTPNKIRINHNVSKCVEDSFWEESIYSLKKKYPEAKILYYNNEFSFTLPKEIKNDVICCNSKSLIELLNNKSAMRTIFANMMSVVPFQEITYSKRIDISQLYSNNSTLVFQENNSSGGHGTHIVNINTGNDMEKYEGKTYLISPYFEESFSVNIHLIVGKDEVLYFPGSIQIIKQIEEKLIYLGSDYIAFKELPLDEKNKLKKYSERIGEYVKNIGYRGVLGIDFLVTKNTIMFVEINARFQSSTPLLNTALKNNGLPSVQEMHIGAFSEQNLPNQTQIDEISVPYSMISYIEGTWDKPYNLLDNENINEIKSIYKDGFSPRIKSDKNSYLFKVVFNTNCVSINSDYKLNIYENLFDIKDGFYKSIINKNKLECKISLLNQGVLVSDSAENHISKNGKIRNAVFNAVDLTIFDTLHVNCPKSLKFSRFTPWKVDLDKNKKLVLYYYNNKISNVSLDLEDIYGNNIIKPNVKFSDLCFWATDRLRIHHNISCCLKKKILDVNFVK